MLGIQAPRMLEIKSNMRGFFVRIFGRCWGWILNKHNIYVTLKKPEKNLKKGG